MSSQFNQLHTVVEPWASRPAPTRATPLGKCVAWSVIDGKAVQCGAKCKGQRCEKHPQGMVHNFGITAAKGKVK